MEISLQNFGKIKQADIQLNGLTVIAGNNDTGKTTVGKAVFCVLKALQTYEDSYEFNLRYNVLTSLQSVLKTTIRDSVKIDNNLVALAEKINAFYKINGRTEPIVEKIKEISLPDLKNYVVQVDSTESNKVFEDLITMSAKDKIFEQFSAISQNAFSKNLNNSVHYDDIATIQFKIKQGPVASFKMKNNKVVPEEIVLNEKFAQYTPSEVTFVDSPLILEAERFDFSETSRDLSMKMHSIRTPQTTPYKTSEDISTLIGGKLYVNERGELKYQKKEKSKVLEISNMASGAKSFALIDVLNKLDLIKNDSILILDEPENHLHPEWQVKLAKLLVAFVKEKDANVLLTSHSPYLIEALQKYAIDENIWEKKTNFYFAEKEKDNYATIKNVRDKCFESEDYESVIFKSFLKAYDALDKIK